MTTYRAMEATEDGVLTLVEHELTEPPSDHVRIAVEACGICHTDAAGIHNLLGSRPAGVPVVPGHEVVGRIDALGSDVTGWRVGQLVGLGYLGGHCGVCVNCRRGQFTFCTDQPTVGDAIHGGYAEFVTARASGLVAVPEELSAVEAAPLLCAGVTVFNGLRKAAPFAGDLVAIQGIGGLGHLAVQYAAKLGLRVVAIARGPEKRELALQLGAFEYIDSAAEDVAGALRALGGAKAILATATSGASMAPLVDGLALKGTLVVVGVTPDPIEVATHQLILHDKSVVGSLTGTPSDNEQSLAFSVATGVRPLVESVPLEKAADAYARMLSGDARFRMVLTTTNAS